MMMESYSDQLHMLLSRKIEIGIIKEEPIHEPNHYMGALRRNRCKYAQLKYRVLFLNPPLKFQVSVAKIDNAALNA